MWRRPHLSQHNRAMSSDRGSVRKIRGCTVHEDSLWRVVPRPTSPNHELMHHIVRIVRGPYNNNQVVVRVVSVFPGSRRGVDGQDIEYSCHVERLEPLEREVS